MLQDFFVRIAGEHPVWQALAGGLVIAGLNMLGATLVLFWRNPPERLMNAGLGVAAGVMLSASFTSLILPGIDAGGIWPVIAGMLLGMLVIDQADRWVPHVHVLITGQVDEARSESRRVKSVLLFIVAITLHNLPEGLAVGVSFGAGNLADALTLMLAIGLQNIPEGLAVSLAAVNAGFSRRTYAFLTGVRAGLVEIPVAVLGALAVTVFRTPRALCDGLCRGGHAVCDQRRGDSRNPRIGRRTAGHLGRDARGHRDVVSGRDAGIEGSGRMRGALTARPLRRCRRPGTLW